MKILKSALMAAVAITSLGPVSAQAAVERTSAPTEEVAELGGGSGIIAVLALWAVIITVIALDDGDDIGDPLSP